jgi:hypothetical protein
MKKFLKNILPKNYLEYVQNIKGVLEWKKRGFSENSPQFIKQHMFIKHGIKDAIWVETGTYLGTTTRYLSGLFPHVHSIEPEPSLYAAARKRFNGLNVTLYNDVSENIFPSLLPTLKGDANFWLDGHYSSGITFQGKKDCPIKDELEEISKNFSNFEKISILIDDVRCFRPFDKRYVDYPSIDYLVDWARKMDLSWQIEHDIFIMQKISS